MVSVALGAGSPAYSSRAGEVVVGQGRGSAQPLGVAEPLVLDPQVGVLAGLGVDLLELLEAVLEHLDLPGPVAGLRHAGSASSAEAASCSS